MHVVAIVLKLGWKFFWVKDRPKNCDEKSADLSRRTAR